VRNTQKRDKTKKAEEKLTSNLTWLVGSSEAKNQKSTSAGDICFPGFLYRAFELPHREKPQNVIKHKQNREKYGFVFFVNTFRHDLFAKRFL
jgi:hypothetical protein